MHFEWTYTRLGDFTYHVLEEAQIKPFLMRWLMPEWEKDHNHHPDQPWTVEWISLLPHMEFVLEKVALENIRLRSDLMADDEFLEELGERVAEREESLLRGVSTEPVVINRQGYELMDGYTRYSVLKKHRQTDVFAYVGSIKS